MGTLSISMEMIVFLVILALAFDFMNGFHDAANSIATVVSTGVLTRLRGRRFLMFSPILFSN
jgi:inorganic phosphate transporter, PiT family